jgi:hypothetical protein
MSDLRELVLHGLTNKVWLWHPALGHRERHEQPQRRPAEVAPLFGEVKKPAGSQPMQRIGNCLSQRRSSLSSDSLASHAGAGRRPLTLT